MSELLLASFLEFRPSLSERLVFLMIWLGPAVTCIAWLVMIVRRPFTDRQLNRWGVFFAFAVVWSALLFFPWAMALPEVPR